jgi:hypothetical protein
LQVKSPFLALCETLLPKTQCLQEDWDQRRLAFNKNMQASPSEKTVAKSRKQAVAGKRKATRAARQGAADRVEYRKVAGLFAAFTWHGLVSTNAMTPHAVFFLP